jgi:hypothetical protein
MKKRSLLTAVVMLVVSAILLTSSTYAWFAGTHEARVSKVATSVSGADAGNVQVAVSDAGPWKTSLDADALYSGNTQLDPIDVLNPKTNMSSICTADYDSTNFEVSQTGSALHYVWYVRAQHFTEGQNIVIPVSFTSSDAIYGVVKVNNTNYFYGPSTYKSCYNVTAAVEGGTVNGIIDDNDTVTGTLSETMTPDGPTSISVAASSTPIQVDVYVWAEGQDAACVGGVDVSGAGFTFGTTGTNQGIHLG